MVAARLLTDLITGKENPAKEVFTPLQVRLGCGGKPGEAGRLYP